MQYISVLEQAFLMLAASTPRGLRPCISLWTLLSTGQNKNRIYIVKVPKRGSIVIAGTVCVSLCQHSVTVDNPVNTAESA